MKVFEANVLSGTCARVCPVEVLCEGACVLTDEGRRPIEIGRLHRFAADWGLAQERPLRKPAPGNGFRVAVLGAGPAGLACAVELALLGYEVTVYEPREEAGGLVRSAIAPYRHSGEPLEQEVQLAAALGVRFRFGCELGGDVLHEVERSADAVFLGIGMGEDITLGLPGEELPGVWRSLTFIEAVKSGRLEQVAERLLVIDGGNTAIDVARLGVRLGAREVALVYRRTENEMPAYAHERAEAWTEGVRAVWRAVPVRFLGRERLGGVACRLVRPAGENGRGLAEVAHSEFVLPADMAVTAIGQQPHADLLAAIDGLEVVRGRPVVDPATGRTTNPKFFAAGDAVNGGATVVEAVHGAKVAAGGIHAFLTRRAAA
jgi:dihydropyrimidine dehydrogenase (NAD+) subunit PreT